jgi:nucleoside-diphosphate-sugar epimerase
MSNIMAITGANGFVGRALCAEAVKRGMVVRGITRSPCILPNGVANIPVGDVDGDTQWADALTGCDVVIHLAARVHVMHEYSSDPLAEFRRVNTLGTIRLAECASEAGVRRLVNVSTIGVNGPCTPGNLVFTDQDTPRPHNPYSQSKWEAEQALQRVFLNGRIEVVTVRPPLIYGPGVGGNFLRLLGAVHHGFPLPFGMADNCRDLLFVENFTDFLIVCAFHQSANGATYLLSDGAPMSTKDLLRNLARALGVRSRLFSVPTFLLHLLGSATGHSTELARLLTSLRIDNSKVNCELDWRPHVTLGEGLQATADWYRTSRTQRKATGRWLFRGE